MFAIGAERQIEEDYIKSGKINLSYRYYPVVDQGRVGESTWAAQAAECANQQGKFWEYHDRLFQLWSGENVGIFTKAKLKQYAADLKLDVSTFGPCLDTDKTLAVVQADMAEAGRQGVYQTPTFLVNGQLLKYQSLDYGSFSRIFDSLSR